MASNDQLEKNWDWAKFFNCVLRFKGNDVTGAVQLPIKEVAFFIKPQKFQITLDTL